MSLGSHVQFGTIYKLITRVLSYLKIDLTDLVIPLRVMGFPGATVVLNPPNNAGDARDVDSIPGLGRSPGERKQQPTPVFLAWKTTWTDESGGLQFHRGS